MNERHNAITFLDQGPEGQFCALACQALEGCIPGLLQPAGLCRSREPIAECILRGLGGRQPRVAGDVLPIVRPQQSLRVAVPNDIPAATDLTSPERAAPCEIVDGDAR